MQKTLAALAAAAMLCAGGCAPGPQFFTVNTNQLAPAAGPGNPIMPGQSVSHRPQSVVRNASMKAAPPLLRVMQDDEGWMTSPPRDRARLLVPHATDPTKFYLR